MTVPLASRLRSVRWPTEGGATGAATIVLRGVGFGVAGLIAVAGQWGSDWPAQRFRAWVSAHHGLTGWTSQWYGGHPLWGYSVFYPALAAVVGAAGAGVLALVLAVAFGRHLAPPTMAPTRALLFEAAVIVTGLECLLIGQIPFLLGAGFAAAAVLTLRSPATPAATALAAGACALSSPLVGVFLLVAAPALAVGAGWRRTRWLAPAALGVLVSTVAGGASGPDPFSARQFLQVLLFCAVLVVARRQRADPLRRFAFTYLAVAAASFAVPNPMGGNVLRLGLAVALPMTVALLPLPRDRGRALVAAVVVAAAVLWPGQPILSALRHGSADPSRDSSYYTGLLGFLSRQDPRAGRLEIPFTRGHWESLYVATAFPLARGWERQTDLQYNDVLYHPLTPTSYRRWLLQDSIALIALPTEAMDRGGAAERNLLGRPVPYLVRVWADRHWTVWRVRDASPLVTGPARLTRLGSSSVQLYFARPGRAVLHLRWSPWLQAGPGGCLEPAPGGWVDVRSDRRGTLRLTARVSLDLVVPDPDCAHD